MVHGHDGHGVLGVRLQVLQDGGRAGSRDLVLVEEKRNNFEPGEPYRRGLAEGGRL